MSHDQTSETRPPMPMMTGDLPGTGGRLRQEIDDFQVTEIPLYEPSGLGTHSYLWVEKRGISSMELVHRMAGLIKRRPGDIGVAGLKDARALTRQWLSVEHVDPALLATLKGDGWRVVKVAQHRNKLRIGHLLGNEFRILIRGGVPDAAERARAVLARLTTKGVSNIFGAQRFGLRGDTHLLGQALLKQQAKEFCDLLLGRPKDGDPPAARKFRSLYDAGKIHEARHSLPYGHREHTAVLDGLLRSKGDPQRAMRALPRQMKKFFVSAWQSALFNQVVAARMPDLGQMMLGDLAYLHDRGAVFRVEDLAVDQPRADRFEISPTGPLFGYRMTQPTGRPGEIEELALTGSGLKLEDLRGGGPDNIKGGRRPMRVPLGKATVEESREGIWVVFGLPSGCYATTVIAEIMKSDQVIDEAAGDEAETDDE